MSERCRNRDAQCLDRLQREGVELVQTRLGIAQHLDHADVEHSAFVGEGELAKVEVKHSSLAIMDMEFHDGELFVSGVAFDNFLSTLRRMPFPFTEEQSATNVEMYHISHDQFETRAPGTHHAT